MLLSGVIMIMKIHRAYQFRLYPIKEQEVIIEDDVWIGMNAVILPGVTIRKGTIVGAGAVVTKSTGEYEIVAGVPAKKIGNAKK